MNYPLVISIPHGSSRVPADIRAAMALGDDEIRDSVDFGSVEIFSPLPAKTVLPADWSRLVVDLNRPPDNRGPKGVVAETDYKGRRIYPPGGHPDEDAVNRRIRNYYAPWHEKLARALKDPGVRALFDCHSLNGTGPQDAPDAGKKRKDVIISNNGAKDGGPDPELGAPSCPAQIMDLVGSVLEKAGFSVAMNDPYKGGYITVHYGRQLAKQGGFAMQVEMNQDLYMDPGALFPDPARLKDVTRRIRHAFDEIAGRLPALRWPGPTTCSSCP